MFEGFKAKLFLNEGTVPKFCRPRTVPMAFRERIQKMVKNYRVTVNLTLKIEPYLLPRLKELLAKLLNGQNSANLTFNLRSINLN
ncbi:K02A2.6-like [Cordylochernes scorpioides]|uniref:K02A2.6-like n=1 Tax=Cordylochernes scorpioides TaxID=51811 RepID=A0ABY6L1Y0_9ARAC|nr:K02A2.6-like [Cordylochernes scorpioides]